MQQVELLTGFVRRSLQVQDAVVVPRVLQERVQPVYGAVRRVVCGVIHLTESRSKCGLGADRPSLYCIHIHIQRERYISRPRVRAGMESTARSPPGILRRTPLAAHTPNPREEKKG